ncbi:MAG: RICIN domain-containing protein [Micromonosporaceae bacterium]
MKRITGLLTGMLLAGALLAGTVAIAPGTAYPATPRAGKGPAVATHVETYRNAYTRQCLDGAMDFAFTSACSSTDSHQKWTVTVWSDGTVRLRNYGNSYCLDIGGVVYLNKYCNTSESQSWYVLRFSDGSIMLKNEYVRQCLRANSAGDVYVSTCNSDYRSEHWF